MSADNAIDTAVEEGERIRKALADVMDQLVGVGIALPNICEGQWHGTEGLDFGDAWGVLKDTAPS